ncbi:hypothetical protein H2200_000965 [Cladophialophora chaetospira]|uniref:Ubiquitin-like domain-containing protein n=1 Tax=Cladophialophora chaetospira TaxID=386627 RepID=A0AA39CPN9_9EURO|nr:hypothetical protein H2200_000965 [Cladophialophora chaetospira]
MTFGYDSRIAFSRSMAGIDEFARQLLFALRLIRNGGAESRPLIFIAHSLGGIVVKKALILSHQDKHIYGEILKATVGIIFLATPHRGSSIATWMAPLTSLGKVFGLRSDLVQVLGASSRSLMEISEQFIPRSPPLKLVSFTEQQKEPPAISLVSLPGALVVAPDSATMGLANEIVYPVNKNHRNICKFADANDETYSLIEESIKEFLVEVKISQRGNSKKHMTLLPHAGPLELECSGETGNAAIDSADFQSPPERPSGQHHTASFKPNESVGKFRFQGRESFIDEDWDDVFTVPVEVTVTRPCYDVQRGYKIQSKQTLADFYSRALPAPVHAVLGRRVDRYLELKHDRVQDAIRVYNGTDDSPSIMVSFHRTVRIPESRKDYPLPPALGQFPLFGAHQFSEQLPPAMAARAGVLLPMYQREAMWLSFASCSTSKFVVRPFVGGVNTISGEAMVCNMNSLIRRINAPLQNQDYVVVPEQKWLDGIATEPGVVRQFVAAPMSPAETSSEHSTPNTYEGVGSALKSKHHRSQSRTLAPSIEWQVTGKDIVGGLQLQLIPEHRPERMFFGPVRNTIFCRTWRSYLGQVPQGVRQYDAFKTPEELGLRTGDNIHLKALDEMQPRRRKTVADLALEAPATLGENDPIEIEMCFDSTFNITVQQPGKDYSLVLRQVDENDNFDDIASAFAQEFKKRGDGVENGVLCMEGWMANSPNTISFHQRLGYVPYLPEESVRLPTGRICAVADARESVSALDRDGGRYQCVLAYRSVDNLRQTLGETFHIAKEHIQICTDYEWDLPDAMDLTSTLPYYRYMGILARGDDHHDCGILEFSKETVLSWPAFPSTKWTTVSDIAVLLAQKVGKDKSEGRLYDRDGNELKGDDLIAANRYGPCEITFMRAQKGGGGGGYVNISVTIRGEVEKFFFWRDSVSVVDVKKEILQKYHVALDRQTLSMHGSVLRDDEELSSEEESLRLELAISTSKQPSMGLGAGAKINQDILLDKNDYRIWDVANSQIVNVQIINAFDFFGLTGVIPPKSPISEETYQQHNLPFFAEQYQEKPTLRIGGAFDSIYTVGQVEAIQQEQLLEEEVEEVRERGPLAPYLTAYESDDESDNGADERVEENPEMELRIVTMDVDDTLPRFRSVAEDIIYGDDGDFSGGSPP